MLGNGGNDKLSVKSIDTLFTGQVVLDGGEGNDRLKTNKKISNVTLIGGPGENKLIGGAEGVPLSLPTTSTAATRPNDLDLMWSDLGAQGLAAIVTNLTLNGTNPSETSDAVPLKHSVEQTDQQTRKHSSSRQRQHAVSERTTNTAGPESHQAGDVIASLANMPQADVQRTKGSVWSTLKQWLKAKRN